jgi:nitronate monooxygenase
MDVLQPRDLPLPIVQAPMAGGPSTPALAAAVSGAGGLGFLAAGYRGAAALGEDLQELRALTGRPFGVNVFVPSPAPADPAVVARYAERLRADARRYGVELGEPRHDDDDWTAKLALLESERVAVASFTFGCPDPGLVARLRAQGTAVWVTITEAEEAAQAAAAGADALVVQGAEAGGHRGSFADADGAGELGLLALLAVVRDAVALPLVATGGIADGRGVAAVLAAGAEAAQIGTALMLAPEAATTEGHRRALAAPGPTRLTRAFTGRRARGLVNPFLAEHSAHAPSAYPEIHHVTAPLRAAARAAGETDVVNLWAGEAHALARAAPAAELVLRWAQEARDAAHAAAERLGEG